MQVTTMGIDLAKERAAKKMNLPFKQRLIFGLIVVVLATLVSLVVVEGLVRWVVPQPLILLRPDVYVPTEQLGWKHAPDTDTRVNTGEREIHWMTDDQGVRIGGGSSQASGMTLVALGDSFLEALQVEYEDTMTALLEKRLSSRLGRSIRILNTGVGGWDPNQYRIQLGKILENRRINGVVVFVYLGNDIISKHVSNIPLKQPAKRHTLRFPNSLRWNELMEAIGYPINDFFEVRSHLFIFVRTTLKYTLMKMGLTAHYFPPMLLRNQASSNSWGITADILEAIAVMGKHHDLKTLFVLLPSLSEVDPEEGLKKATAFGITPESIDFDQARLLLGEQLRRRGLSVVDMTPSLRTAIKERMPDVYGRVDTHLGRGGHQVVANAIEDVIWRMFCTPIQDPPASLLSSKNRGISAHSMFTSSEGKTR